MIMGKQDHYAWAAEVATRLESSRLLGGAKFCMDEVGKLKQQRAKIKADAPGLIKIAELDLEIAKKLATADAYTAELKSRGLG